MKRPGVRTKTTERILQTLKEQGPKTTRELMSILGISDNTVWTHIQMLRSTKEVRIGGWKRSYGTRGRMGPRWTTSPGEDTSRPRNNRAADNKRYYNKLTPYAKRVRNSRNKGRMVLWLSSLATIPEES